jgi:hypothetical protein
VARSIALSKLREELMIERETRDIRKWSEGSLDVKVVMAGCSASSGSVGEVWWATSVSIPTL